MPEPKRTFDCYITWALSSTAQREFPVLVFRADVDYATSGFASLTSTTSNEVVAVVIEAIDQDKTPESDAAIEALVNSKLDRTDLRMPALVRSEDRAVLPDNISFQDFRRLYQPPRLFYTDIYGSAGEAEAVREQSIDEYLNSGGVLTDLISNALPHRG